ncbi:MAG: SMP-30/gluconolactonase/LRE family protein, partial [Steroidobacteraceae bacterium]
GREPGSNGLTFDAKGRLVYCRHGERDIARREPDGRISVLVNRFREQRFNSPNDLVHDSKGNLYFTDPHFGLPRGMDDLAKELRFQGVYRLSADGRIDAIVTDLEAPNGVALSPDERTLYVANATKTRPIWMAYTIGEDGAVSHARQFAEASRYVADGKKGVPDGMKVDKQGNVFATGPNGVHIFAPDGARLGRIVTHVPTGNVAWGEDGSVLFIAANHRILRVQTSTRGLLPQNIGAKP